MLALFEQEEVTPPTKSNEWYTPARYIEASRRVMGSIDLDPASCEVANRTVKAAKYYSIEDDGLSQKWSGCVWLNPPYSIEEAPRGIEIGRQSASIGKLWIDRLIEGYTAGDISSAILLAKADVKQIWFQPLWEYPICFTFDRVYFDRPGLPPSRIMFGTVFVYLGTNESAFIEHFSPFGRIAKAIDVPKQPLYIPTLWE